MKMKKPPEFDALFAFDQRLRDKGFKHIAGLDEAGRGALAGPLVGAAVILPHDFPCCDIRDSKLLDAKKREEMFAFIAEKSIAWATAVVPSVEIDERGLTFANQKALRLALEGLSLQPDYVLSDGFTVKEALQPILGLIKGDRMSLAVAAASIMAKVTRDRLMSNLDLSYPGYDFSAHKGYGTSAHWDALNQLGPSEIHRRSFKGVV